MSQNRQTARDRDEAEHDYQINREAFAVLQNIQEAHAELKELIVQHSQSRD
jgi:uncharacterized membrane protein